jgi:hypothetical protein
VRKVVVTVARRWAVGFLSGAFLLAVATPCYLAYSRPGLAGYLLHPGVFVLQGLPYAVAAALWVPAWSWGSDKASVVLAALLATTSLAMYTPVLWAPAQWGGDMISLAFLAMSGVTIGIVFALSALTALAFWWRRERAPSPSS